MSESWSSTIILPGGQRMTFPCFCLVCLFVWSRRRTQLGLCLLSNTAAHLTSSLPHSLDAYSHGFFFFFMRKLENLGQEMQQLRFKIIGLPMIVMLVPGQPVPMEKVAHWKGDIFVTDLWAWLAAMWQCTCRLVPHFISFYAFVGIKLQKNKQVMENVLDCTQSQS